MEASKCHGGKSTNGIEMGVGREGMSVMCDTFNMPPPCHHKAWDNHVAALYQAHKKAVADQLQKARTKFFHSTFVRNSHLFLIVLAVYGLPPVITFSESRHCLANIAIVWNLKSNIKAYICSRFMYPACRGHCYKPGPRSRHSLTLFVIQCSKF